jgi:hypothetical protein
MTSAAEQKMMPSAVRASSLLVGKPGELHLQKFEIVGDRVQVAAGLIDLLQRELAFV